MSAKERERETEGVRSKDGTVREVRYEAKRVKLKR